MHDEFDYVIVGGGTAGCVLANRLTQDGRSTVLLLEAGGEYGPLSMRVPIGFKYALANSQYAWHHRTVPDIGGRVIGLPRGKVLGGSSSVNGLVFVRGQREDYDGWREAGCDGWGWDDVLPYFRKLERYSEGGSELRGADGPLSVTRTRNLSRASDLFIDACVAAGLKRNPDYNSGTQDGVSYFQMTTWKGWRTSSASAYIAPVRNRANLAVMLGAHAHRIRIENKRATAVVYARDGVLNEVRARAEVIVAAGAITSPQLLMLSGVGPGEQLAEFGVPVIARSPKVGRQLRDHYNTTIIASLLRAGMTLNERTRLPLAAVEVLRYLLLRKGLFAASPAHVVAFARSSAQIPTPDLQLMMLPAAAGGDKTGPLPRTPGISVGVQPIRPASVGEIRLASADPTAAPLIRANYLSDAQDQRAVLSGLRLIRRILAQSPLVEYITGELQPGRDIQSDEDLLAFARATGNTAHHPVGTCGMGPNADDVLDPQLRVRGVERLRVVDASAMPMIVSGNTCAATLMIAEKAADTILSQRL